MTGVTQEQIAHLSDPFAPEAVHWRAQSMSERDGKCRAMALAYIDARDVQDRLDRLGPENWSDSYVETPKGRIICTLSIRIGDEWVSKSDGAGETDVEGDKGALSDAMKRAAVKWGIGRYLYAMPSPWVPCEKSNNGKFKRFTEDPWKHVPKQAVAFISDDQRDVISVLAQAANVPLIKVCEGYSISDLRQLPADKFAAVCKRLNATIKQNSEQKEAA